MCCAPQRMKSGRSINEFKSVDNEVSCIAVPEVTITGRNVPAPSDDHLTPGSLHSRTGTACCGKTWVVTAPFSIFLYTRRMEPTSQLKKVKLFIHGTCTTDKLGPAGWACRLVCENVTADMSGSDPKSSVNRMSLRAAIEGLRALKQRCLVTAYTNSEYLFKGMTWWVPKWKTNGWQTETGGEVKNQAVWQELGDAAAHHVVRWQWIKSDSPDLPDQQACEKLALDAATQQTWSPLTRKAPERGTLQEADAASAVVEQVPA